ncbi:hypothetical protein HOF78_00410 [Candidatus Woesearchaeota archaeon]|jgi:hypothetical protein|nr:hypothetical protein [Candidatus Woesearchaeota archaeon]MBT6044571.1 hypothetical protein [Candidatus Woesearchaeota archaeon]
MVKRRGKKTKVSIKRGNDFLSIFILVVLLLVFASLRFGGFLTGSAITDIKVENEVWRVNSCSIESASDMALELKWNYGCGVDYCREATYGLELPLRNIVDLKCDTSDQRSKWEGYCKDIFEAIC